MKRPSMPADLRERFGPVVPVWELGCGPRPLDDGGPDTAEAIVRRRDALASALRYRTVHRLSTS